LAYINRAGIIGVISNQIVNNFLAVYQKNNKLPEALHDCDEAVKTEYAVSSPNKTIIAEYVNLKET
jgi:hypothetical protein